MENELQEWIGGKPIGCVAIQDTFAQVVFRNIPSKCFSFSKYETPEEAIEEAKRYQKEVSDREGKTKNMYRYIDGYLEVKLQNDHVMKCEIEHLPIVEERVWTANKTKGKYTYYVKSRESVKRNQEHCMFHNRVYPELTQVDHINRDGLDNRKSNVREGSGRINPNNKRQQKNNTSGVKGVYNSGGRWTAQWIDIDGKKRQKGFSIVKHGNEEAFRLACKIREDEYSKTIESLNIGENE
jgi:hypothetical protein